MGKKKKPLPTEGRPGDDFEQLLELLKNSASDDRTVAIMCAAYCEKYILQLIEGELPGLDDDLIRTLFNPGAPLGSAATRFHLARAMNLISSDMHAWLRGLANVRNAFAHNVAVTTLDHPMIAEHLAKITWEPRIQPSGTLLHGWAGLMNRAGFELFAVHICMTLHNAISRRRRIASPEAAKA